MLLCYSFLPLFPLIFCWVHNTNIFILMKLIYECSLYGVCVYVHIVDCMRLCACVFSFFHIQEISTMFMFPCVHVYVCEYNYHRCYEYMWRKLWKYYRHAYGYFLCENIFIQYTNFNELNCIRWKKQTEVFRNGWYCFIFFEILFPSIKNSIKKNDFSLNNWFDSKRNGLTRQGSAKEI